MENLDAPSSSLGRNVIGDGLHSCHHQTGYIDRILTRFQMQEALPAGMPLDPSIKRYPTNRLMKTLLRTHWVPQSSHCIFVSGHLKCSISTSARCLRNSRRHLLRYLQHSMGRSIVYLHQNNLILRLFGYSVEGIK